MMNNIDSDRYIKREREYRKNPASLQNLFCYTVEEIKEYINEICSSKKRAEIALHLNIDRCPRCRSLFTLVKSNNYEDRDNFAELSNQDKRTIQYSPLEQKIFERIKQRRKNNITAAVPFNIKNRIEKGQIWTASPAPKQMLSEQLKSFDIGVPVLIADSGNGEKNLANSIKIMPLSFDTDFHKQGETFYFGLSSCDSDSRNNSRLNPHGYPFLDLADNSGVNPLNYPFLVEIFNEISMPAGNLLNFKGLISKEDMDKIDALLKQHDNKKKIRNLNLLKDKYIDESEQEELRAWQQTEIKLFKYLSEPVGESVFDKEIEISLSQYKMAADDNGLARVEEKASLINNDKYSFTVIQKQEKVILRFDSPDIKPSNIFIDTRPAEIKASDYGEYDVEIGTVGYMSDKISVGLTVDDKSFEFNLKFKE